MDYSTQLRNRRDKLQGEMNQFNEELERILGGDRFPLLATLSREEWLHERLQEIQDNIDEINSELPRVIAQEIESSRYAEDTHDLY